MTVYTKMAHTDLSMRINDLDNETLMSQAGPIGHWNFLLQQNYFTKIQDIGFDMDSHIGSISSAPASSDQIVIV